MSKHNQKNEAVNVNQVEVVEKDQTAAAVTEKEEAAMSEMKVTVTHEKKFTDKVADAIDTAAVYIRRNWKKLLIGAVGIAGAVVIPLILGKDAEVPAAEDLDIPVVPDDEEDAPAEAVEGIVEPEEVSEHA